MDKSLLRLNKMTPFTQISFERRGPVGHLTLQRPEKRNAQTLEMWQELRHLGQQLLAEPDDIFDLLDAWIVIHRNLPLASSPENVAAVTNWARTLGTRALPYFDGNRHWLGSPSICFKRTFWPFT